VEDASGANALPDFLTIEEAARVARIGRNPAYALAKRYRDTNGAEGLPVVAFGRTLRVPRHLLEQMAGGPLDVAAFRPKPRPKAAAADAAPLILVDSASTKPTPKRARRNDASAPHPRLYG
jgi:hypothetical protein